MDEDRPVRRGRGERLELPGCCRVRVRSAVAPTVRRDHQRFLRRPDVLAGAPEPGRESGAAHFDASFQIGTTSAAEQSGLHMSVSPDDGNGSRMSYLRFEDQSDGVHVFFDDVTNPGPFGAATNFTDTDIATLNRTSAHTIRFSIDFFAGPANDVVKIYVDGVLKATGTTWEDYYRYDPEQLGNGNVVPPVSKLLFREGGTANPSNAGNGFLVDDLTLASSATTSACDFSVSGTHDDAARRLRDRSHDPRAERLHARRRGTQDHRSRSRRRTLPRRGRHERRLGGEREERRDHGVRPRRRLRRRRRPSPRHPLRQRGGHDQQRERARRPPGALGLPGRERNRGPQLSRARRCARSRSRTAP